MKTQLVLVLACLAGAAMAQEIQPYHAQEIQPYRAQEIEPARPAAPQHGPLGQAASRKAVAALLGAWRSSVPGAAWTSPSAIPGWDTLHVSPGALAGLLVIYPNGTYVWNSYGGKKGRWMASNDADYPIVLDDTVEHRQWRVGADPRHRGQIFIYDGNAIYYTATRAARD